MNEFVQLPQRIVLCGVSASGKSTLGDKFGNAFGHKITAFADPLKLAAQTIFGFDEHHLWGASPLREMPYLAFEDAGWCFECGVTMCGPERRVAPTERAEPGWIERARERSRQSKDFWKCLECETERPGYVTPRTALQTLGTGWGRELCPDVWAGACFRRMHADQSYVVTDCRFHNELEHARRARAVTVLLLRGLEESTSNHPSELEVRQLAHRRDRHNLFDLVLDNREGLAVDNFRRLVSALREKAGELAQRGVVYKHYQRDAEHWAEWERG